MPKYRVHVFSHEDTGSMVSELVEVVADTPSKAKIAAIEKAWSWEFEATGLTPCADIVAVAKETWMDTNVNGEPCL